MQAVYACITSGQEPDYVFNLLLKDIEKEVEELEKFIKSKAENWELDRIARIDRILMHMAICEMLNFEEIPVKVTINEYLELAKTYSTPKSSKFINGILDSLYNDFRETGKIVKKGRGLINHSAPKTTPVEKTRN
ncbi:UNVERIFIED_CONTAM: hypothetical protein GTU68_064630 [Idotea baltica]|nr:hypothetical protein [Idotea baltica]